MCSEGHQVWRQDVSLLKITLLICIFLHAKLISKLAELVIHHVSLLKPIDRISIELH